MNEVKTESKVNNFHFLNERRTVNETKKKPIPAKIFSDNARTGSNKRIIGIATNNRLNIISLKDCSVKILL